MAQKAPRLLFLNLMAFSKTGGIEKFNRCFLKALQSVDQKNASQVCSYSLYDNEADEKYFQKDNYKGFSGNRLSFVWASFIKARKYDYIILGHINLAIVGFLIKLFLPKKKLVLVTHGIEVWQPLKGIKKFVLKESNLVLTVSNFTKQKLLTVQQTPEEKIRIFYNTIDPYFSLPDRFNLNVDLRNRYNIKDDEFVLYTLTRLSSSEKYKGYDVVLKCIPSLSHSIPNLKYVIAGKYDEGEKARLDTMISELDIKDKVVFAGYISDAEINDHYQMANVFIMPSQGEGFGIVFIEAMVCGLTVIAGNQDGSVDALQNGQLGILIHPENVNEIVKTLEQCFQNKNLVTASQKQALQEKTLGYFSFDQYKKRLSEYLFELN